MNETPYELLLKKSRQRKKQLFNSIEEKSLKNRSISYNMKIQNDFSQDPQIKPKDKEKSQRQTRINYTSCLKKSYYYRKFLNQTAEGHLTHQQFSKLKDTFNKIGVHHSQTQKNPAIFREIWENQMQRKYSIRTDQEKQLQLAVKPKINEKNSVDSNGNSIEIKRNVEQMKKKLDDISQIARKRKLSLDFDLQIQGNKKDIKIKDGNTTKSPKKIVNTKQTQERMLLNLEQDKTIQKAKTLTPPQTIKTTCNFLKRFQQTHKRQHADSQKNACIKIKKIRPDRRQFLEDDKFHLSNNLGAYRQSFTRQLNETLEESDIRYSWNGPSDSRYQRHKVQTSQKCRISIRRHKKIAGCSYTNDIQGWNVKAQNEDQNNQVFGD